MINVTNNTFLTTYENPIHDNNEVSLSMFSRFVNSNIFTNVICSIWMILLVFGTLGNGLVIFIAIRYKKLNDMMNLYIFNLAITDILFSLFCIPFTTILHLYDSWFLGNILCKLCHFFSRASVQITCLTLMAMTIHRCNAIIKNKTGAKNDSQRRIVIISTLLIWLVASLISSPDLLYYSTRSVEERTNTTSTVVTHCQLTGAFHWFKLTNMVTLLTAYTLPLLIIILSYARLLQFLASNQRRLAKFNRDASSSGGSLLNKTNNKANTSKAKNKTKRVTKMVALITFNFGICWLLTHVLVLLKQFDPKFPYGNQGEDIIYFLKIIAHTLTYCTPMINVICYGFYNETFRVPLSQIFTNIKNAFLCRSRN